MHETYSYDGILDAARRVNWRIEDVIGGDSSLDFAKPMLPETLARTWALTLLNPHERLALNQIRGHGYLCLFALVEEFILPFVLDHAEAGALEAEPARTQAFARFAQEEAKHIRLFQQFRRAFERGFGTPCAVIGPAEEIGRAVRAHHPLAVALAILHIEWMTQRHYVESVREDRTLDPHFKRLLRYHWLEEAQHAKLDTLMVEELAAAYSERERERATIDYLKIVMLLDDGLASQAEFDLEALAMATGREFTDDERERITLQQHQALRWTFLGSGMTHPKFLATLQRVRPEARERIERLAQALS